MPVLNQLTSSLAQSSAAQNATVADLYKQKVGMLCFQCGEEEFKHFPDTSSWTYNFKLFPVTEGVDNPYPYDWANEHGTEFVPMTTRPDIPLPDGDDCSMLPDGEYDPCTVADLVDAIQSNESTVPVQYLMGFNQPYDNSTYVDAVQAAGLWAKYHMPVADTLGLKLVSPTVNASSRGIQWMTTFLQTCVDAEDADPPCDYTTIKRIPIHNYHCDEHYVQKKWGPGGKFQQELISSLGTYGGKDWTSFVQDTPYWVSATNCNWDGDTPNNVEQCLRITGQNSTYYGEGGMYAWATMDQVERIGWWNVATGKQGQNAAAAMMMNKTTDELYPVGRAFANLFGSDTDCTSEPTNDLLSTNTSD